MSDYEIKVEPFDGIKIQPHSDEWRQIRAYAIARINQHRKSLESSMTPIEKVPQIRAQIAELRALLKANVMEKTNE